MKSVLSTAKVSSNCFIDLDIVNNDADNILLIGNTTGFFGYYYINKYDNKIQFDIEKSGQYSEKLLGRLKLLKEIILKKGIFTIVGSEETIKYYRYVFDFFIDHGYKININTQIKPKTINNNAEYIEFLDKLISKNMKFDYIIQNPPYKGNLHINFFNKGLDMLSKTGKMVIIEPAAQLYTDFGQQENSRNDVFTKIFPKIEKHVYKVKLLNANKEFNVGLRCPFAITYIDMENEYNKIECDILGEQRTVASLKDVNLIGNRDTINWIIQQVKNKLISKYGSCENVYIKGIQEQYDKAKNKFNICSVAFLRNNGDVVTKHGYESDADYVYDEVHKKYYYGYITASYVHKNKNEVTNKIEIQLKNGKELSHPNGYIYFDKFNTFDENKKALENFKKFILTSNLAHFITIVYPGNWINQKGFMPLFTDEDCSDDTLYNMFDKSDMNMYTDAINLIEHTCDNFQRDSEFFKNLES